MQRVQNNSNTTTTSSQPNSHHHHHHHHHHHAKRKPQQQQKFVETTASEATNPEQVTTTTLLLQDGTPVATTTIENKLKATVTQEEEEIEVSQIPCIICAHDIDYFTFLEKCDHKDICWKCTLTQRELNKDKKCPICKETSEQVILAPYKARKLDLKFEDLQNPETQKNLNIKKISEDGEFKGTFLVNQDISSKVKEMRIFKCKVCSQRFENMKILKQHLYSTHKLFYCDLCLEFRKMFLKDQKLYTSKDLKNHRRFGEEDPAWGKIHGHPYCRFCQRNYYADEDLFNHMHKDHFTCFICQARGVKFEYYKDYEDLERHFDQNHYLCHHPRCLELKFIVFGNEVDLRAHEMREHGTANKSARVRLDFGGPSTDHIDIQQIRRQFRVGEVNSNVIQFVGASSFNEEEEEEQQQASRSSSQQGKRKDPRRNPSSTNSNDPQPVYQPSASASSQNSSVEEEAKQRNKMLIKEMKIILNPEQLDIFKQTSIAFQKGNLLASEYYQVYYKLFGENAERLFNDLVETLPDQKKRDALILAKSTFHSSEFNQPKPEEKEPEPESEDKGKRKKHNNNNNNASGKNKKKVDHVPTVASVVNSNAHVSANQLLQEDWPSLQSSSSQSSSSGGNWLNVAQAPPPKTVHKDSKPSLKTDDFPQLPTATKPVKSSKRFNTATPSNVWFQPQPHGRK